MNLSALNEYSAQVASELFAVHPEWTGFAAAEDGALVVRIPCPVPDRPEIAIYTADDEITVGYDRWHAHYDCWSDIPHDQGFQDALACINDLLSEQTAVAVTMTGDQWAGSRTLEIGDEADPPGPGQHVYVRSWLGTRDSVVHAA